MRPLQATRDPHTENVSRWNTALACRTQPAARLAAHLIDEGSCRLVAGAVYCNADSCRLGPTELRLTGR